MGRMDRPIAVPDRAMRMVPADGRHAGTVRDVADRRVIVAHTAAEPSPHLQR